MTSCIRTQKIAIKKNAISPPSFLAAISDKIQDEGSEGYALYLSSMLNNIASESRCAETESLVQYLPNPTCGNGVIDGGEICDFGIEDNGGICKNDCTIDCTPGDGRRGICTSAGDYHLSMCHTLNSYIESVGGPTNFNAGDCATFDSGFINSTLCDRMQLYINNCPTTPVCGNSILEVGETCDFGTNNGVELSICLNNCNINCTLFQSPEGENACSNSGFNTDQCTGISNYVGSIFSRFDNNNPNLDILNLFDYSICSAFATNISALCGIVEKLTYSLVGLDSCASDVNP